MLLLNLGLYVYQCVNDPWTSVTNPQLSVRRQSWWGAGDLRGREITHYEPVYVQQIKRFETLNYKKY